jgi:hypothetical protein
MLRQRNYLTQFVRRIGFAGFTRRSAPVRRTIATTTSRANKPIPVATARAGRGFTLSPTKPAATTTTATTTTIATTAEEAPLMPSGEKLLELEDELSKLRAEIDALMSGGDATANNDTSTNTLTTTTIIEEEEEEEELPELVSINLVEPSSATTVNDNIEQIATTSSIPMPPPMPPMPSKDAPKTKLRRTVSYHTHQFLSFSHSCTLNTLADRR